MTAAETVGSILWMVPEMTWEFQHNASRHLWDELRHSQLGQIRVQQLGFGLGKLGAGNIVIGDRLRLGKGSIDQQLRVRLAVAFERRGQ